MRYIVSESQGQIHTAVWGKSQFRDDKGRECSHRDYLRNNGIAFEDVLAVGDVHFDPKTGRAIFAELPWDGPKPMTEAAKEALSAAATTYFDAHKTDPDAEIAADWTAFQAYQERQRQFLASQR